MIPDKVYRETFLNLVYNPYDYFKYDNQKDIWIGLYGFTNDQELKNKFLDIRNRKYFKVVKRTVDKDTYEKETKDPLSKYKKCKIDEHSIKYGLCKTGKIDTTNCFVVMTRSEKEILDDYVDNFNEEAVEKAYDNLINFPDFRIFNQEIIDALETIEYTKFYSSIISLDENLQSEVDEAISYGLSYPSLKQQYSTYDEMNIFIRIFNKILSIKE